MREWDKEQRVYFKRYRAWIGRSLTDFTKWVKTVVVGVNALLLLVLILCCSKFIYMRVVNLLISRFGNKMAISVLCLCRMSVCLFYFRSFTSNTSVVVIVVFFIFYSIACFSSVHFFCFLHFFSYGCACVCVWVWLNDSIGILTILHAFRLNLFSSKICMQSKTTITKNNIIVLFVRSRLPRSYTVSFYVTCRRMPLYNTNTVNRYMLLHV